MVVRAAAVWVIRETCTQMMAWLCDLNVFVSTLVKKLATVIGCSDRVLGLYTAELGYDWNL